MIFSNNILIGYKACGQYKIFFAREP
jgi:hypothetical protein